ncbi:hypothetical protein DOY81_013678 [Sarcophaga bullata]|nr:hypothetical protein DOY81_013678 [Sarcophaga bullata]
MSFDYGHKCSYFNFYNLLVAVAAKRRSIQRRAKFSRNVSRSCKRCC